MNLLTKEEFKELSYEKIFERLETNERGLKPKEAQKRQQEFGFNEIPEKKQSLVVLFLKKFWGLTAWMLEFIIILSIFLKHYLDAYFIGALLLLNAILSFYQESKSSQAVEALKKQLAIKVRTLRDQWVLIDAREVTIGDIIRIRAGDFVPADVKIIDGMVGVDQSALTGESQLIQKTSNDILYSGSIIKNGECTAVVVFIGSNTYFGKTTQLVELAKPKLNIEHMITKVVKFLMVIVAGSLIVTFVVSYIRGENLFALLPLMLILLVSAIPVALPAMFTVSMALGSQQLSKKGILVTRLNASEDVASMTTLCADKTGTITENRLTLSKVKPVSGFSENDIYIYGALCSLEANHDPIDLAFINACKQKNIDLSGYEQINFIPFDPKLKRTQAVVKFNFQQIIITKGAYESICNVCPIIDHTLKSELDKTVSEWATNGYKTIAISIEKDSNIEFVGIAALYDPPRKDSSVFIKELRKLGVKIKMLTGDAKPIAKEIAKEVEIGDNIAEPQIIREAISSDAKKAYEIASKADGFCEVLPEDKFYIVKALQSGNEIVGMTGDGVNDAPALKQAEVGIAVSNATDIAKKAASVVLVQEGLGTIVNLIKMGRIIHHRVLNWIVNKIVKTFQTVVFVCIAYLITGKFVVSALDVVLLLFIIDFVTISFSTDNVRWSKKPEVFNIRPIVNVSIVIGILTVLESLIILYIADKYYSIFSNLDQLHSFGFGILLFSNIFNVFVIRERGHFWESVPSRVLLVSMLADFIVGVLMMSFGIIVHRVPFELVALLVFYLILASLFNDFVKVALSKLKNH
ncbi:plasma-membrane proton-efflux P-type ATPase [Desulfurella sp.]|uniref:plasma-membrane proton-efflux P-type ATPase n=1 Tax=Desulfurella sp. TaxID=1962857 RepID=UPI0025BB67BE|nr:plasma-membrane proton-efflux P-type ATPase [Desulfurella sp.]